MSKTLTDIAQELSTPKTVRKTVPETTREVDEIKPVPKVQLIYAFNGTGKTRLSREFKKLIAPQTGVGEDDEAEVNEDESENGELSRNKILYYNAFTEDLFYWDNDLQQDAEPKLCIQANTFTDWILKDQGQDGNIIENFQRLTDEKLTPHFNEDFSSVSFSFERGNEERESNIKVSKGEESSFVWSVFYTLLDLVIETLNIPEEADRDTQQFNQLEYVFVDDPVSSLDENHLIEMAIRLARLIKRSQSTKLKFIITTHNPLFYNVLHNEFNRAAKYVLRKYEDGTLDLIPQKNDSPFSYHLQLKSELKKATETGQIHKYHFNYLRNILEKTSTFFGVEKWGELLPELSGGRENPYARIINIYSHSEHASEEIAEVEERHKNVLSFLVRKLDEIYESKMRSE